MALVTPTYPDSGLQVVSSPVDINSKEEAVRVTGDFTGTGTTEYNIRITGLTEGCVAAIQNAPVSGPGGTLTNQQYTNVSTTTVTGTGSGLKVTIDVKSGAIDTVVVHSTNTGTGYQVGDTFKVLGNVYYQGTTPGNDTVFKVSAVSNKDLKYKYKYIVDGVDMGWLPTTERTATMTFEAPKSIDNGLYLGWGSFDYFKLGETIAFTYRTNGSIISNMHILNTKDGAHLLKFSDGELHAHYNIDKQPVIDQQAIPDITVGEANSIGILSVNSNTCDFSKINSKSVNVGLGGEPETPPKWVGLQQFKQWKKSFNKDSLIIEDAELKISTEIPQLDDIVALDTAHWYDENDNKAGTAGAWTAKYWAGFSFGTPDIFVFRVMSDALGSPLRVEKVIGVEKYGIEKTGIANPVAITTDGPNLYVLDKVGGGLLHCFKFIGSVDSGEATAPVIEKMDKYNSNWPYALPDTPKGIAIRNLAARDSQGAGAWYSDIMVTPSDGSMNTNNGGNGKLWIQASWTYKRDRDYARYIWDAEWVEDETNHSEDAWYPPICGHEPEQEWLWSINISNPAHPTGMTPDLNMAGRLLMINRSPALDKFYCNNPMNGGGSGDMDAFVAIILRGTYDVTTSTGSNPHPQGDTPDEYNDNAVWIDDGTGNSFLARQGLGQPMQPKEVGIMQTLRFGLTDIGEDDKIGVTCLYASSDQSLWDNIGGQTPEHKKAPYVHLAERSQPLAEVASSSAYYASSYVGHGNGATHSSNLLTARDKLILQSNSKPKEVDVAAIPASQVPTFNIIDGSEAGFSKKPLIIPLAEDCIKNGWASPDIDQTDYMTSKWGESYWGYNNFEEHGRELTATGIRRVLYNTDGSGNERLVTFDMDGTVKTYDLSALYAANSLQTGSGANSWNKSEFLRVNPYDEENDNIEASVAGKTASELIPGGITTTGNLQTATGFIQHPKAQGMNFGSSGLDSRRVCFRDADKYEVDLFTHLDVLYSSWVYGSSTESQFYDWEQAYGAKGGRMNIFTLPSDLPNEKTTKINHNDANKATQWDYLPTSIYNSNGRIIVFNQRKPQISYLEAINLHNGIKEIGTYHGYSPLIPFFTITGMDAGMGVVPTDGVSTARTTGHVGGGKSSFLGVFNKASDHPDGTAVTMADDGEPASSGGLDYMYYSFSFVYDGYQESPLADSYGSTLDADSGWTVQKTGDGLQLKITIPDIRAINKRVSHINFYRSKNKNDPAYAKAFYQLIESVKLDDTRWVQDGTNFNKYTMSLVDLGRPAETYETRTGVSELLENTQPHYGIACQGDGYQFISQAWHQTLDDHSNYVFRSKPGKFNIYDWSTDWLELPEYPTALSYHNGKLFAFSAQETYMINPRTMTIEEDILQCGCLGQQAIMSCDYGMVWADKESIWMYNGVKVVNIGLPIEQGGNYSYRERAKDSLVFIEFDSVSKCFLIFMKPKLTYTHITGEEANISDREQSSYSAVCWAYHAEKNRWDYWILKNNYDYLSVGAETLATCRDWRGGVLYSNNDGLFQLGADKLERKPWSWISKNFVMGYPTLDKRFYKIRAVSQGGMPMLEYKVNDAILGLGVGTNEKVATKKGKRIKVKVRGDGDTAVDSVGIIYRKPKAK